MEVVQKRPVKQVKTVAPCENENCGTETGLRLQRTKYPVTNKQGLFVKDVQACESESREKGLSNTSSLL